MIDVSENSMFLNGIMNLVKLNHNLLIKFDKGHERVLDGRLNFAFSDDNAYIQLVLDCLHCMSG